MPTPALLHAESSLASRRRRDGSSEGFEKYRGSRRLKEAGALARMNDPPLQAAVERLLHAASRTVSPSIREAGVEFLAPLPAAIQAMASALEAEQDAIEGVRNLS